MAPSGRRGVSVDRPRAQCGPSNHGVGGMERCAGGDWGVRPTQAPDVHRGLGSPAVAGPRSRAGPGRLRLVRPSVVGLCGLVATTNEHIRTGMRISWAGRGDDERRHVRAAVPRSAQGRSRPRAAARCRRPRRAGPTRRCSLTRRGSPVPWRSMTLAWRARAIWPRSSAATRRSSPITSAHSASRAAGDRGARRQDGPVRADSPRPRAAGGSCARQAVERERAVRASARCGASVAERRSAGRGDLA